MNKYTKVIIVGGMPCSSDEFVQATKVLASCSGFTLERCRQLLEEASNQFQEFNNLNLKSIKEFSIAANQLKVSMRIHENSQPKSKYINNPRHNFKTRGIPQKRNNRNYYKK